MVHPVDQICAGGVPPLDLVMVSAIRVLLVKNVVPALPEDRAIDIVYPAGIGHEVVSRPVRVVAERVLELIRILDELFDLPDAFGACPHVKIL